MEMKKILITALCLVMGLGFPAIASARAEEGHIGLRSVAEMEQEIVNEKGEVEVVRVTAQKVLPGAEVIFTTFYENISSEKADDVIITNPVPEHMNYQGGSAAGEGAAITFSVDGGNSYDRPENLKVKDADGKERVAEPSEYTHIRWTLERSVLPGEGGEVVFRAILQ